MPSIKEKLEKSKCLVKCLHNIWLFIGIGLFLTAIVVFGSIKLAVLLKAQNAIGIRVAEFAFETNLSGKVGAYVGSKNGKSYYFPWCGIVDRIKNENLIWFATRADAEKVGYKLAANCHGLK